MNNTELIKRLEEIGIEQVQLFKECITRFFNGELTQAEFNEIQESAQRRGAEIVDYMKADKDTFEWALRKSIDTITDENR